MMKNTLPIHKHPQQLAGLQLKKNIGKVLYKHITYKSYQLPHLSSTQQDYRRQFSMPSQIQEQLDIFWYKELQ